MPIRFFTIGQVATKTGLPTHTIRYWEKEFKTLNPVKNHSGRRKYSERDLALVQQIQNLLHDEGYTIKGAREIIEGDAPQHRPKPADAPKVEPVVNAQGKTEREIYLERKLSIMKKYLKELQDLLA